MVIDTSALLAILLDENERRAFNEAIEAAESRFMSVASFVEVSIVIESRFGAEGVQSRVQLCTGSVHLWYESAVVESGRQECPRVGIFNAMAACGRFGRHDVVLCHNGWQILHCEHRRHTRQRC